MKTDEYNEVINHPNTFKAIAEELKKSKAVLIGWTDENYTHFDILFTYKPTVAIGQIINGVFVEDIFLSANFQGGIRPTDLFVSIMRVGAFGFEVNNKDTHWSYYDEKLGSRFRFGETIGAKLAELINGVKKNLLN